MSLGIFGNPIAGLEQVVTISTTQANLNAYTAFGSPSGSGTYRLIINSGVRIYATSTATAALVAGSFPAGSTLIIVNNGDIIGKGGNGGNGGTISTGSPGSAGGDAISLSTGYTVQIDNTNGNVWAGGGGGGGGGIGGGGRGGGGGGGKSSDDSTSSGGSFGATSATGGNRTTAGSGATGETSCETNEGGTFCQTGGTGGSGGDHGAAGSNGGTGDGGVSGGAGGAAGRAVRLNGNSVTWLGGNTSAKVKGAVS